MNFVHENICIFFQTSYPLNLIRKKRRLDQVVAFKRFFNLLYGFRLIRNLGSTKRAGSIAAPYPVDYNVVYLDLFLIQSPEQIFRFFDGHDLGDKHRYKLGLFSTGKHFSDSRKVCPYVFHHLIHSIPLVIFAPRSVQSRMDLIFQEGLIHHIHPFVHHAGHIQEAKGMPGRSGVQHDDIRLLRLIPRMFIFVGKM